MNLSSWPIVTQLQTKQPYNDLPKCTYSTAFGSLLTDLNCSKQVKKVYDSCCTQLAQSVQHTLETLIDLLAELIRLLSSIIKCRQFLSERQLKDITNAMEQLRHFRSTLLMQLDHVRESFRDVSCISYLLQNLDSFVCYLHKQQNGTFIQHPQTVVFRQLLNRVKDTINFCLDSINRDSNAQVDVKASAPIMFPYMNYPRVFVDHPIGSTQYLMPCNESNMCVPWSVVEQIKNWSERDNTLGLMYDIEDVNIRPKLRYENDKFKRQSQAKRAFRKALKRKSSIDAELTAAQQTSMTSTNRRVNISQRKEADEVTGRASRSSIPSQRKDMTNKLDGSRSTPRQQSLVNSKRSTSLLGELPKTTKTVHNGSRHTSSRLSDSQVADAYKEIDDHSALWSPVSFETSEYRYPSKTTIKMSRESSSSLSPTHKKSANRQPLSKVPSTTGNKQKTRVSGVSAKEDKQSLKTNIDSNPNSYQTFVDSSDPTMMFKSDSRTKPNEGAWHPNWKERLVSPLSIKSTHHINSPHPDQKISAPILNSQSSIDNITSDFNFSEHPMSQSPNSLYQTNVSSNKRPYDASSLMIIASSKSEEGIKGTTDYFHNNKERILTAQFSPGDAYHQRSSSATSDSEYSSMLSDRTIKQKTYRFSNQAARPVSLAANKEGYFIKFINCFRRKNANRVNLSNYKKK